MAPLPPPLIINKRKTTVVEFVPLFRQVDRQSPEADYAPPLPQVSRSRLPEAPYTVSLDPWPMDKNPIDPIVNLHTGTFHDM